MKILAVTSCATGIAHTFMAAEALSRAGIAAGHEMIVETQGSGAYKPLSQEVVDSVDVVIIANDVEIRDKERFAQCTILQTIPKNAIKNAKALIEEAVALVNK